MSLFTEVFASLPRQGPGSAACTRRALEVLRPRLPAAPVILDIGCGSGAQTLTLARELPTALLTAVDLSQQLLEQLQHQALAAGLANRIRPVTGEMGALPASLGCFDLIWSEGAIYIIGLEAGLQHWGDRLGPAGSLAFSHISWLTETPSPAADSFWQTAYPQMASREQVRETIRDCGYTVLANFVLPTSAWWQDYYQPLEQALERLPATAEAKTLADECRAEIELYRQFGTEYGYVFWCLARS